MAVTTDSLDKSLVHFINGVMDKAPLFRKTTYLLALWWACSSPTLMKEDFTVPSLDQVCRRYLNLKYFERTKVAYTVYDSFVRAKYATSRSEGSVTYYKIAEAGAVQAAAAIKDFRHRMEADNADLRKAAEAALNQLRRRRSKMYVEPSPLELAEADPQTLYRLINSPNDLGLSLSAGDKQKLADYRGLAANLNITEQDIKLFPGRLMRREE